MRTSNVLLPLLAALTACASSKPAVPAVRFANAPPVTVVDDRQAVALTPKKRAVVERLYQFDGAVTSQITRPLELRRDRRALGVNAFDEVPDSTWFTNRIGVRDLSIEELVTAGATKGSPEAHKPWTIHSTKERGESVGFVVSDRLGRRFLLKFDRRGFPEMETAAQVIVAKILWAAGYNVSEDYIVHLAPADLRLAANAVIASDSGRKRPLRQDEVDFLLSTVERTADGRIRGMASWWIEGTPLGGHPDRGVRADDPNDRIPHELRRDLRGAVPIFAWVDHLDVKDANLFDVWVSDPANPAHRYVKHYWLDFGKSLGVMVMTGYNPRRGYEYYVDFGEMFESLATLGIHQRPWERRRAPNLRGVGMFDATTYRPGHWHISIPSYEPFLVSDALDKFWGAKILMRFTREQLRAIVDSAQLSDPRAAAYLTDTLVQRQRATARHWFQRVNPVDRFTLDQEALCFDDLLLAYDLSPFGRRTRYTLVAFDGTGRPLPWRTEALPDRLGHACTGRLPITQRGDGYTIIKITTTRPGFTGSTYVHVARDPKTRAARVIGIWRP